MASLAVAFLELLPASSPWRTPPCCLGFLPAVPMASSSLLSPSLSAIEQVMVAARSAPARQDWTLVSANPAPAPSRPTPRRPRPTPRRPRPTPRRTAAAPKLWPAPLLLHQAGTRSGSTSSLRFPASYSSQVCCECSELD